MISASRERALGRVKEIVLSSLGDRLARVYLFGSCATGQATDKSDIDVAIEPLEPLPAHFFAGLRETLEESTIPYFIDVIDMREIAPALRRRILEQGVTWRI
jgi:predicted nucleotidyltransferase